MANAKTRFKNKDVAKLADAVCAGDIKKIKALVQAGVSPNARSKHGAIVDKQTNLLEWAIYCQSKKGFLTLLDVGADPLLNQEPKSNITLLHFAAMNDEPDYLEMLLEHGVDPNIQAENGETALYTAIDKPKHVQLLLKAGADIQARRNGGANLLFVTNHVKWLLEKGVNPSVRDDIGRSFQTFYFLTPENVLLEEAKEEREWVRQWLHQHNIKVEG